MSAPGRKDENVAELRDYWHQAWKSARMRSGPVARNCPLCEKVHRSDIAGTNCIFSCKGYENSYLPNVNNLTLQDIEPLRSRNQWSVSKLRSSWPRHNSPSLDRHIEIVDHWYELAINHPDFDLIYSLQGYNNLIETDLYTSAVIHAGSGVASVISQKMDDSYLLNPTEDIRRKQIEWTADKYIKSRNGGFGGEDAIRLSEAGAEYVKLFRTALFEVLKEQGVSVSHDGFSVTGSDPSVTERVKELSRVIPRAVLDNSMSEGVCDTTLQVEVDLIPSDGCFYGEPNIEFRRKDKNWRSYYPITASIMLRDIKQEYSRLDDITLVHELGHFLEFTNPRIRMATKKLAGRRKRLAYYDPEKYHEAFATDYNGKTYPGGETELFSTGLGGILLGSDGMMRGMNQLYMGMPLAGPLRVDADHYHLMLGLMLTAGREKFPSTSSL